MARDYRCAAIAPPTILIARDGAKSYYYVYTTLREKGLKIMKKAEWKALRILAAGMVFAMAFGYSVFAANTGDAKSDTGEAKKEEVKKEAPKAESAAPTNQRANRQGRRGNFRGGMKIWQNEEVKKLLNLTDAQIKKLDEGSVKTDEEWSKLFEKMRANRQTVRELANENSDEAKDKSKELTEEGTKLREQMTKLQDERQKLLDSVLNKEQKAALKKWEDERASRFGNRNWGQRRNSNANNNSSNNAEKPAEKAPATQEKKNDGDK